MNAVYELVDATEEERYWPLGVFPDLASALAEAQKPNPKRLCDWEPEECIRLEIRERKLGERGAGKTVSVVTWVENYDPESGDGKWFIQGAAQQEAKQ